MIFLMWWTKGFLLFVALLALTETAATYLRTEYQAWLKANRRKPTGEMPQLSKLVLFLFVLWPLFAIDLLIAMFKGQTMMERSTLRNIATKEREQLKKREYAKKMQIVTSAVSCWVDVSEDWIAQCVDFQSLMLLRQLEGQHILSHVVMGDEVGGYLCVRAMPIPKKSVPWDSAPTLKEAMEKCLADYDWAVLCLPGMEQDQWKTSRELRRQIAKNLKEHGRL